MANGDRTGLLGGLARGIEGGVRMGLLGLQLGEQRAERAAQEKDREMNRNLAKMNIGLQLMTNKHLPAATKLQAFNEGVVGPWNAMFSAPGSTLSDNLLSPITEWNDALSEYGKRAQKILGDKTLTTPQKQEGLAALMVEAQGDFNLAPMVEALKAQGEQQLQADTLRAYELLVSDGKVTDDEATEWTTIGKRSPKALLDAEERWQKQKKTIGEGEEKKTPLRAQFLTQSKDFVTVRDAYSRVQAASEQPSAAGDIALIFSFMKMTDPGSVVRESEFATAQNAAGVPDRIRAMYNRLLAGERLAPNTRQDFVSQANAIFRKQLQSHTRLEQEFSRLAKSSGFAPEDIVVDFIGEARGEGKTPAATQPPTSQAPPATGASALSGQRTNKPDGVYRNPQTGESFTVKDGVIQ